MYSSAGSGSRPGAAEHFSHRRFGCSRGSSLRTIRGGSWRRTLDVMGDGELATPAAEPGWYNYDGFWWFWNGERWMPPSNPQRAPVASVLAWVSWMLLLTFFWPMLVVAWVVPLAVRSAASR